MIRSLPPAPNPPVLSGPTPFAIAHRGSRILWPENTMLAFSEAISLGFSWLETDLLMTSDGVVVCHHDPTLERTTNASGPVAERAFADLKAIDAGYRHDPRGGFPFRSAGTTIPSLEELVTSFPSVKIVVDLKRDDLERPLFALIERFDLWDRLVVGSFSDRRLRRFRALTAGRVATSTGPQATLLRWVAVATRLPPPRAQAIQVPVRYGPLRVVSPRSVGAHHRVGTQVHVWTVNEIQEMTRLLDWGVDGIITDRPDLLRSVMIDRGHWRGP